MRAARATLDGGGGGAAAAAVRRALAEGGGVFYTSGLLSAPSREAQRGACALLSAMLTTSDACAQLVASDALAPLLGLLSYGAAEPALASSALSLVGRLCARGHAAAAFSNGAAPPLAAALVRAAAHAKGWGGGHGSGNGGGGGNGGASSAAAVAAGARDAKLCLTSLTAIARCGERELEAVRHAVRAGSALPSVVALLGGTSASGPDAEGVDGAAMGLLGLLDPRNEATMSNLASTGGIALLCETVGDAAAPDASRLQAVETLAALSASAVSAVAISEDGPALRGLTRSPRAAAAAAAAAAASA